MNREAEPEAGHCVRSAVLALQMDGLTVDQYAASKLRELGLSEDEVANLMIR